MAPERITSLAILDMRDPTIAGGYRAFRWIPDGAQGDLIVLWESSAIAECPAGFVEAVEGVVCIAVPPGYKEYRYTLDPSADPSKQSWRGPVSGDYLMIIVILAPGYAFAEPLPGTDWPIKAKLVGDRMAVYWIYEGNSAEPAWRMSPVEDMDELRHLCTAISDRGMIPLLLEPPLPSADALHRWMKEREAPIEGPPP
jgi:hypothetical protein